MLDAASLTRLSDVALRQLQSWHRFWDQSAARCAPARRRALPAPPAWLLRRRRRRGCSRAAPGALAAGRIQRAARRHRALVRAAGAGDWSATPPGTRLLAGAGAAAPARCAARSAGSSRRTRSASTPQRRHRPAHARGRAPRRRRPGGGDPGRRAHNVKGGETRVFDARGPHGLRFTLAEPWSVLLLDDARVIHETTPIQPLDAPRRRHRDTLVLTYRAGGFQDAGLSYAAHDPGDRLRRHRSRPPQRLAGVAHRTPVLTLAHRRRAQRRAACSSSARTCSAWAPSSSAAPTTRWRSSRPSSAAPA